MKFAVSQWSSKRTGSSGQVWLAWQEHRHRLYGCGRLKVTLVQCWVCARTYQTLYTAHNDTHILSIPDTAHTHNTKYIPDTELTRHTPDSAHTQDSAHTRQTTRPLPACLLPARYRVSTACCMPAASMAAACCLLHARYRVSTACCMPAASMSAACCKPAANVSTAYCLPAVCMSTAWCLPATALWRSFTVFAGQT